MICAVYARKSTDQAGAGDKSESVERQLAHALAYAARKGWTRRRRLTYTQTRAPGLLAPPICGTGLTILAERPHNEA